MNTVSMNPLEAITCITLFLLCSFAIAKALWYWRGVRRIISLILWLPILLIYAAHLIVSTVPSYLPGEISHQIDPAESIFLDLMTMLVFVFFLMYPIRQKGEQS